MNKRHYNIVVYQQTISDLRSSDPVNYCLLHEKDNAVSCFPLIVLCTLISNY